MTNDEVSAPVRAMWRPLGFGELFDRAIVLYVRNIVTFTLVGLVVIVPSALIDYYLRSVRMASGQPSLYGEIVLHQVARPQPFHPQHVLLELLGWAVFLFLGSIVSVAFSIGVATLYDGSDLHASNAYRSALGLWWPVLRVLGGAIVRLASILFPATLLAGFILLSQIGGRSGALGASIAVGVLALGLCLTVAALWALALSAVAVEHVSPRQGWRSAFERIGTPALFWRAFGVIAGVEALSYCLQVAIDVAVERLLGNQVWTHTLLATATQLVTVPLISIVGVVLYFDLRIRREGLDLHTAVSSLRPQEANSG